MSSNSMSGKVICLQRARKERDLCQTGEGVVGFEAAAIAAWESRLDEEVHPLIRLDEIVHLIQDAPDHCHPLVRYLMGLSAGLMQGQARAIGIASDVRINPTQYRDFLVESDADQDIVHWSLGYADGLEFSEWITAAQIPTPAISTD